MSGLTETMREFWILRAEHLLDQAAKASHAERFVFNERAVICLRLAALDGRAP